MKKNTMSILASSLAFVSCVVLSSVVFLGRDFSDDSGTKEVSGISVDSEGLLEIGTFPQSLVSEDCTWLIPQLDAIQWTNMRGFIEYDGEQYKRVVAHPDPYSPAAYFDDGTPIVDGQTYYFKVEPIKWRVLDEDTGMVLSDQVLEAQVFSSAMKYSNEWGYSTLRSYLNNIWYDYTFTAQEKASILLESHPFDTNFGATTSHTGDDDYVFLPSGTEYMDPNLGFSNTMSFDNSRRSATTEFARATGCSFFMSNTSRYWSRSGATGASVMCVSGEDGQFSSVLSNDATIGVRPALMIDTDVLAPTEIIGEYTRGDVVIDVSNSSDYDDPRGPVPFHFEILDETWTSIILTMWHEEIPAGYQFMINHDPLTVDLYISGPDEDHQFLPASDFGISSDVVSVSLIENDLCLTMDFTMTGGQTYLFYTTIEATNANNQGQIIEDYIYLSCNADWQKIVLDYLHGEVRVDENGRFTFFFELNESRQDWTKISYNLSPRGGNGTYITHEITKEASSINSWVEIRNGVTGIDFAAVMNVSGNVISLVMVGNNGMYPLDQMWDLNIIVYNNSYEVQRIRNELVLREYSPIVVYYTSDLVEMSTTALYNIYQFEFADLTWTKIDALFVSRGTNTAYVITINNDAEGNRVFYEVLRRTLGSNVPDEHVGSFMAQMYGNRLSIRFDVSVLTGPLFDVSMTVQNENYLTQTIETTVQYIFNQPFAPIFNYYSDYYVDIISGYYDTRLRFYFDYDVTAYYDMRRTQYSLISRDDPSLYYSFVFDGYLGISSFYTYYDHVIIDEYNLVGDISNSIIPTVDQYQAFIEIRVPVDEEDFAGKIFDVAAIVTTYSGGVQYEYSSVMCYLV